MMYLKLKTAAIVSAISSVCLFSLSATGQPYPDCYYDASFDCATNVACPTCVSVSQQYKPDRYANTIHSTLTYDADFTGNPRSDSIQDDPEACYFYHLCEPVEEWICPYAVDDDDLRLAAEGSPHDGLIVDQYHAGGDPCIPPPFARGSAADYPQAKK